MKRLLCGAGLAWALGGILFGCRIPYRPADLTPPPSEFPDLPPYIWQPLLRAFEKQARGLSPADQKRIYERYIAKPRRKVRVAVIDVVPPTNALQIRAAHSTAVRGVISALLCSGGDECRDRVDVPLPSTDEKEEYVVPFLAFDPFKDALAKILAQFHPADEHLVINVAVGWDPIKVDADDPRIKALVALLKQASCMGALVVAPSGNVTGTNGPMIPAVFESFKAPSAAECYGSGVTSDGPTKATYAPLVYAVGALDAHDRRLVTDRPWSQPRLAAYGLSVSAPIAPGADGRTYTFPLSGTSAATAIVSAVAATVWTTQPDLDAHQVMALVYAGGVALDGGKASYRARTEFCLNEPFGPCNNIAVHRVVLCGALKKSLPNEPITCLEEPLTSADLPKLPGARARAMANPSLPCRITGCGAPLGPLNVQVPNGLVPQPGIPTCPGCFISFFNQQMVGRLLWEKLPKTITRAIVETFDENFLQTNSSYQLPTWTASPDAAFELPMAPPPGTIAARMVVDFPDENGVSKTAKVPLIVNLD